MEQACQPECASVPVCQYPPAEVPSGSAAQLERSHANHQVTNEKSTRGFLTAPCSIQTFQSERLFSNHKDTPILTESGSCQVAMSHSLETSPHPNFKTTKIFPR